MPPLPGTSNSKADLIPQISANLSNALSSFGPQSAQYNAVLDMLRGCILELQAEKEVLGMPGIVKTSSGAGDGTTKTTDVIEGLRELLERGLRV
ncbi:hypothetical protein AJ79_08764 [Helicocarpus griseus UAMH5409]|uniref:Uncharacterized protein n=1 Tax=Helicocarpus griseus UAMH5409 TaxID=1447875 RepID=A0A2B7WQ17_9EURO|nr:hypothetical protein AJ79_08764 [Helicocarpus griseus UAMH5409]